MTISPEDLVRREVHYCVSYLVSTLSINAFGVMPRAGDLAALCEQASELAAPIDDWEEAAIQAGWSHGQQLDWSREDAGGPLSPREFRKTAQEACEADDLEPYQREVYEHWIVSDWLADELEAEGEKVDKDFAGLTVWARTTTGQAIAADGVIERICAKLNAEA